MSNRATSSRYTVRQSVTDGGLQFFRVFDARDRRWIESYTREAIAEAAASRLEREHSGLARYVDGWE